MADAQQKIASGCVSVLLNVGGVPQGATFEKKEYHPAPSAKMIKKPVPNGTAMRSPQLCSGLPILNIGLKKNAAVCLALCPGIWSPPFANGLADEGWLTCTAGHSKGFLCPMVLPTVGSRGDRELRWRGWRSVVSA